MIACLLVLTAFRALGSDVAQKPLPIKSIVGALNFTYYVPIDLSPDGHWVAFTAISARHAQNFEAVRYSRITPTGVPINFVGSDIWIANTSTGEQRNLTNGQGSSWAPIWSPNGEYLAFISDRSGTPNVWLWERRSGAFHRLSAALVSAGINFQGAQWTPDSRHIVIRVLPSGMDLEDMLDSVYGPKKQPSAVDQTMKPSVELRTSPEAPQSEPERQIHAGQSVFGLLLCDLAIIDVPTGVTHRIAQKERPYEFMVSPNGTHVAVMSFSRLSSLESQMPVCELTLVALATGSVHIVASDIPWNLKQMTWSPDGKSLLYGTIDEKGDNSVFLVRVDQATSRKIALPPEFGSPSHCSWLWGVAGGAAYTISETAIWRLGLNSGEISKLPGMPGHTLLSLIAARGGSKLWSPEGEIEAIALAQDNQTLQEGFWKIDLTTGKFTKISEGNVSYDISRGHTSDVFKTSDDGRTLAYIAEDAQHPADVWAVRSDLSDPHKVTNTSPELDNFLLGQSRLIHWRSLDGEHLKGSLLLPAGYREGKRYPLIVYQYGGGYLSTTLNEWGGGPILLNTQLFATRGYAVLLPDAPLRTGTPVQDLSKTVLPGINKAIELGIADPDHIGIMGQSYGGYCTLALIENSRQFKAAVDFGGLTNLVDSYANDGMGGAGDEIGWVEEGWGRMGGSLWKYRDRFIENSPLFYLDKVDAPILIIHGDSDVSVPVREGHLAFGSLRRLGKVAVYAEYKGEGHTPQYWSYADQTDLDNRIINWFDKYLK